MGARPDILASLLALLALAGLSACVGGPSYRDPSVKVETVETVDLNRYAGLWYEIARYPNAFERDCYGVTAAYTIQQNGKVGVTNTCLKGGLDGPKEIAQGRARVVAGTGGAKLKVQFSPAWVPFAEGNYWVLGLGNDYEYAVVGDPSGKFLWFLARSPRPDASVIAAMKAAATENGYALDPLEWTVQPAA
jgi:apolipoprotein D and lipocalin family protein